MRSKLYIQNSAVIIVIGFYDPHHDISSDLISNKTVSAATESFAGVPDQQVVILGRVA